MVGEADTFNNKLSLLIFLLGVHVLHYFLSDRCCMFALLVLFCSDSAATKYHHVEILSYKSKFDGNTPANNLFSPFQCRQH